MNNDSNESNENDFDICGRILIICSYILVVITFPITVCFCMKVCEDYLFIEKVKIMFFLGCSRI